LLRAHDCCWLLADAGATAGFVFSVLLIVVLMGLLLNFIRNAVSASIVGST
jgi:hypothetical protein